MPTPTSITSLLKLLMALIVGVVLVPLAVFWIAASLVGVPENPVIPIHQM